MLQEITLRNDTEWNIATDSIGIGFNSGYLMSWYDQIFVQILNYHLSGWSQDGCFIRIISTQLIIDDETLSWADSTKLIQFCGPVGSLKSLTSFLNIIHGSLISLLGDKLQDWSGRTDINIFTDWSTGAGQTVNYHDHHLHLHQYILLGKFLFNWILEKKIFR